LLTNFHFGKLWTKNRPLTYIDDNIGLFTKYKKNFKSRGAGETGNVL